MKVFRFTLLFLIAAAIFAHADAEKPTPQEALHRLKVGNARFVNGRLTHPNREKEARADAAKGQTPFAVVLCCSDSRAPPEILFDEGIGDLFIVRVAGNVLGPVELASVEYGVHHLGASIILVLGHESCGAVTAVVLGKTEGIEPIAELIEPAVKQARTEKGPLIENAIIDNVEHFVAKLKEDSEIDGLIKKNKLMVAGGYFELLSGKVRFLEQKK